MGRFVVWMSQIDLVIAIRAMCMPNVATGTPIEGISRHGHSVSLEESSQIARMCG